MARCVHCAKPISKGDETCPHKVAVTKVLVGQISESTLCFFHHVPPLPDDISIFVSGSGLESSLQEGRSYLFMFQYFPGAKNNLQSLAVCFAAVASAECGRPIKPGSVRQLPEGAFESPE